MSISIPPLSASLPALPPALILAMDKRNIRPINLSTILMIRYQATPRLSLDAGYRFYSFVQEEQSNEDGNRIHLRTHGPMVQAAYRF